MSDQERLYDAPVGEVERNRLASFSYPNQVSRGLLDSIGFSSCIDAGAGTGTSMAEYVIGRGASYTAFDFKPEMVAQMNDGLRAKNLPACAIEANILNIPATVGRADVVHERFVLMHLSSADRSRAVGNLLDVANRNVLLMEYNWRTMRSSRHSAMLKRFEESAHEFMELVGIDPYAGETMQKLVRSTLLRGRYEFVRDQRPEGDYTSEFIALCEVQNAVARRLGRLALAEKAENLKVMLSDSPIVFVPPEVVVAVIQI
jgi:hypothetical protein